MRMAAIPVAPARMQEAALSRVIPPIANTGMDTARQTCSSRARPCGGPNFFFDRPKKSGQIADREQGVHAILERFSDSNQQSRREGHGLFAGFFDRAQAFDRSFVGRVVVRGAGRK